MANRTRAAAVEDVLDTDLSSGTVTSFIDTANILVTEYLVGEGLSDVLLLEIETYVAAHLVTLRDRRTKAEGADGVRFDYQGEFGMGLDSSQYGQTAQFLDSTGILSGLSDDDRISFIAKAGSEATNVSANVV